MTINGTDISKFNARQWNVVPGYSAITNKSEAPMGFLTPIMFDATLGLKQYIVNILVNGTSRQEILTNSARIAGLFIKPAVVKLDGFTNTFVFSLTGADQDQSAMEKFHLLKLTLVGYEYGDQQDVLLNKSTTIDNPGTLPTPVKVEIVPNIGQVSFTLYGLTTDRQGKATPLVIRSIAIGKKIIIDGETGIITQGGISKIKDVDITCLPYIQPGKTTVSASSYGYGPIHLLYKPRCI